MRAVPHLRRRIDRTTGGARWRRSVRASNSKAIDRWAEQENDKRLRRSFDSRRPDAVGRYQFIQMEVHMATFIVLMNFTEQGIKTVKDSPARYEAFKSAAGGLDIAIKSVYWTVGHYDIVLTVEGTDQAVTSALLKLGSQGNVRTETLRGYTPEEIKTLLSRMP
jgi:uncharacterized protein with GYD domain